MSNIITKPFLATGLTQDQRIEILDQIGIMTKANTAVLQIINTMEDQKKALALLAGTQKIGAGLRELFMLIK